MDLGVYRAVISNDLDSFRRLITSTHPNVLLLQVTSQQQDTALHLAAKFKRKEIATMIMNSLPSLVYKRNSKGDTPLHVAARLGCSNLVEVLINFARLELEADEKLLRMVNTDSNTALHEAARRGHFEIVLLLIGKDPHVARVTNNAGESPLFVAVDNLHLRIASHIIEAAPICSVQGRNKMNALHAAVIRSYVHATKLNLDLTKLRKPLFYVVHLSVKDVIRFVGFGIATLLKRDTHHNYIQIIDLIKQLMEKYPSTIIEANNVGWTPFHYAAFGGHEDIVRELLLANNSVAYIKNGEGMTGLHIAAREGHVPVLETIVEACPDIWDLKDNNGRTALHVAAESGKGHVVKFILKYVHEEYINEQDNEGNTALHLATLMGREKIFKVLTDDERADKTIMNRNCLAVLDIINSKTAVNFFRQGWMKFRLSIAGGLASLEQGRNKKISGIKDPTKENNNNEIHIDKEVENKRVETEEVLSFKHLRNVANTNILVSTLIATVSFAAAFTIPGGYKSNGSGEGRPVFSKKASFNAFIVSNTIAFSCSIASLILHNFAALLVKRETVEFWTYLALVFSSLAICGMFSAFIAGSFVVLANSASLIITVLLICCILFALQFPSLISIDLLTI